MLGVVNEALEINGKGNEAPAIGTARMSGTTRDAKLGRALSAESQADCGCAMAWMDTADAGSPSMVRHGRWKDRGLLAGAAPALQDGEVAGSEQKSGG